MEEALDRQEEEERISSDDAEGLDRSNRVPPPFTEETLARALEELPSGARQAVETCLNHWREK
eukprot:3519933-Rhodomonas_salina.1